MTAGTRLRLDLEVLRIALGVYLEQLRALWDGRRGQVTGAEVGADRRRRSARGPSPTEEARREVAALLAREPPTDDPLARARRPRSVSTTGEELLVAAAWWAEADPQFAILLGCAHDDGARRYASAALLRLVLEPFGIAAPRRRSTTRGALVRGGAARAGRRRGRTSAAHADRAARPRRRCPPRRCDRSSPAPARLAEAT